MLLAAVDRVLDVQPARARSHFLWGLFCLALRLSGIAGRCEPCVRQLTDRRRCPRAHLVSGARHPLCGRQCSDVRQRSGGRHSCESCAHPRAELSCCHMPLAGADGSHKHSARGPRVLRAATNVRGLDPPFEAPRRARLRLHMVEVSVRTHWMACTATQGTSAAAVRRTQYFNEPELSVLGTAVQ
mgnify:FL=1